MSQDRFRRKLACYRFLDYVVGLVFVSPCIIVAFHSLWVLEDITLYPDNPAASALVSCLSGHLVIFVLFLSQEVLEPLAKDPVKQPVYHLVAPLYKLIWSCAFINQWRSVWIAYGLLLDESLAWAVRAFLFSFVFLGTFRALPLVGASAPHVFVKDNHPENTFQCQTRFATKLSVTPVKCVLDCLLSVCVLQTVAIVFWRSMWTILDRVVPPPIWAITFSIGVSCSILSYFGQDLAHWLVKRLKSLPKIVFQNIWLAFCGFCCISTWHGVWLFMDELLGFEPVIHLFMFSTSLYLLQAFFDVSLIYTRSILVENKSYQPKSHVVLLNVHFYADIYKNIIGGELMDKKETIRLLNDSGKACEIVSLKELEYTHLCQAAVLDTLKDLPETFV